MGDAGRCCLGGEALVEYAAVIVFLLSGGGVDGEAPRGSGELCIADFAGGHFLGRSDAFCFECIIHLLPLSDFYSPVAAAIRAFFVSAVSSRLP